MRRLIESGPEGRLAAERRPITVLFTDIEGFTRRAERLAPETMMRLASLYLAELSDAPQRHGGTIDTFIGDSVMAYWNAPRPDPLHANRTCLAALAARDASRGLAPRFAAEGWPCLRTRIGLHSGEAVVGIIGSPDRLAYTAVGSVVNLASRLEGLNAHYGTEILVSETTWRDAGDGFLFRPVDLVLPKGGSRPVEIFELMGRATFGDQDRLAAWEDVVHLYRRGAFAEAAAQLVDAGVLDEDPLVRSYRDRLAVLADRAPPPGWSPVVRFDAP